ncbi:hypothetical protein QAD02_003457 [Eretmocerus hayati]|uniref:Uncharacterized protein n=1 Tax=Eretmocerus hayati TaxID=131215 RepID=A0ACC2NN09_9HYME|nr:hypothetical protein QAD02_003457 [Eretmocerus hayati]
MGGWSIPPFMPPFMPPHVTSTASIREVRDSESERNQRTTAGGSNDSSGDDAEYIRQQRDRLQDLRGSQTTNQVPSNPQAPPIAQMPVGPRIQETSQGAYAGETRQRPREDRREQVRTTLPMHGESEQPGPTQQASMQVQAPPGIRHSQARDQSSRRDWFSGSSSSDEWEMETPVSKRSHSKGKQVVSRTSSLYPWGYPPYPYWQMPGASGMPRNARRASAETQEEGRDSGNSSPLTPREDRASPSNGGPSHHLGAIPRAPMVERRSRDRRRRARPEPIGSEATAPRCPSAAAALAVVAEEPEPALDTGSHPEADSVRAQEELRDWLEPRRTPVHQIPKDPGDFEWPPTPPELQRSSTPPRPATRRDTETPRGTAAGAPTPDEFREPALIIAP